MNRSTTGQASVDSRRPVWITGAGGLIGNYLVQTAPRSVHARGLTRAELDLSDFAAVRRRFQAEQPAAVIHCAALSDSVLCRQNPALARQVNVDATAVLAELAAEVPFLFFSTDLVFDGRDGNYDESAAANPLSIYGETKAAAEKLVLANPGHTVIRTSLNGGISPQGNRAFNEQLRNAFAAGRTLNLFVDEFRTPIPAVITARAVWELTGQKPGLYHVSGAERLSRWQIGELLAARWPELHPKIQRASLKEYAGDPRPPDTSLSCAKAQGLLSFPLPRLTDWLAACPKEMF